MKDNKDQPAYGSVDNTNYYGLTKREAFAMAAMQGILSSGVPVDGFAHKNILEAVIHADALLKELEKGQ